MMRLSLHHRLLAVIAAAVMAVTLLHIGMEASDHIGGAGRAARELTEDVAATAIPLLQSTLVVGDLAATQETLDAIMGRGHFQHVRLLDTDGVGTVIEGVLRRDRTAPPVPAWFATRLNIRFEPQRFPIAVGGTAYGIIEFLPTADAALASVWEELWGDVGSGVLLIVLQVALLGITLRHALRPLETLSHTARQLGNGDLSCRAPALGATELRETAEAFNRMADKLTDAQATLEERVQLRTRELHAKEGRLREVLALNENILETSAVGIAAYRADGQCVMANAALAAAVGGSREQVQAHNFHQLDAWRNSGLLAAADQVLATGNRTEHEARLVTSFGRDIWMHAQLSRFINDGEPHLLLMLRDVTAQRESEEQLRLAASVFQNSAEGVLVTDANGTILSVNPAFADITGYTEAEVLGRNPNLLRSDRHDREFFRAMWDTLLATGQWQGEIWNRRKDGEAYLEWLTINRIADHAGATVRYISVFHDVTELRRKDERIHYLAFHDVLTGLPNRTLFQERLEHAIDRLRRDGGRLSVTFIDLDGFKDVNDTLGHDIGDLLLQEIAKRIRSRLRRGVDTVARLGGDEFVVLMEDLKEAEHCACLAGDIIADISQPLDLRGHKTRVGASMGMAFFPEDGDSAQELMKHADTAMYAAKLAGKGTYRFFRSEMLETVTARLNLEDDLRGALRRDELILHYQPKVRMADGAIRGVEALVRWHHPHRGLMLPGEFIPLAEETGLILPLGNWVLEEACRQAAEWRTKGLPTAIAVNVSAQQIAKGRLRERIGELISRYRIPPAALQIELTETALMINTSKAVETLEQLREMGIVIAIDDFGTGYSSLSRLRQLPIDLLKIDRSFVMNSDRDEKDAQVVRMVVGLAKTLGMDIIAEGVESERQAELLTTSGCTICQGHYYAEPHPADHIESLLRETWRRALDGQR